MRILLQYGFPKQAGQNLKGINLHARNILNRAPKSASITLATFSQRTLSAVC